MTIEEQKKRLKIKEVRIHSIVSKPYDWRLIQIFIEFKATHIKINT